MSRDPAFLFYDGDAARDVSHMNRLERGAYFDIIQSQRKFHGITVEQARKVLGKDFDDCWPALEMVLSIDEQDGRYYIPWLRESIQKRQKSSEKQRKRIQDYWDGRKNGKTGTIPRNYRGNTVEKENENRGSTAEDENGYRGDTVEIPYENENEKGGVGGGKSRVDPEHLWAAQHLLNRIRERRQPVVTESTLHSWARDVRLMIERDGRTLQDINTIIDECHDMEPTASGFSWRDNILSMSTLRTRWKEGKISIGMSKKKEAKFESQYDRW